ncbi:hypothetical protein AGABI2DRAFT_194792 [Agaricus bisporus var. bisporus H97]|uniref:hypothetical protein n=1 Tax=Agaricus bisporus var. bisporus (strain H97 / ATCC MYA-4626 / FGSC 10389) TaxID=936046 RepID=UPI00029F6CD2|nr:hypothetical protein AGABI2DRAFT_194792 [Agaricus bisporus var. bisporus H97]EKV43856.1 hypothetical protein AGABI2DRAFT_194792 [Agaricus bisporus var. bisporus H97]
MSTSHTAHSVERPERSRNAKAQARHRAKRKAYIEQLEQTVTKLQMALNYTPDQISVIPPPLLKIRELEQEVARLQKENDDLRSLVHPESGRSLPTDFTRRSSYGPYQDSRLCDRNDYKRRKHVDGVYLTNDAPLTDSLRPPPLTIPQPLTHHYGNLSSNVTNHNGSSSTSSPPFSPAQMQQQPSTQQHMSAHRPSSMASHSMSNFSQSHSYDSIKMEDENYPSTHPSHHNQYSVAPYTHTSTSANMDTWSSYSSERALHR